MSPRNWGDCPQCHHKAKILATAARGEVEARYGKVPLAEWERLQAVLARLSEDSHSAGNNTLREEWEFDHGDGVLVTRYSAACVECAYTVTVEHEHKMPPFEPLDVEDLVERLS